jgi:signal transduction histidine kinase
VGETAGPTRTLQRLVGARPWVVDAALATGMVVAGLVTAARDDGSAGVFRDRDALGVALVLASTVPYYLRRRFPLAVLTVATSALVLLMLRSYDPGGLPFTVLLGCYSVGALRPAREAAAGAAVLAPLLGALVVADVPEFGPVECVLSAVAFGAAIVLGQSMRSRSERIDAFAQQQHEAALRAAADERLRIAQEMHDVVAHSLGVIAVQAGVGMHVIDSDPEEARRSLANISTTSRASLAEIRRLLGLVRDTSGAPAYSPAPGLADIDRLAEEIRSAGLRVDLAVEGDTAHVPAGVGLAAYRIVQEALTNALRHADARRAAVRLDSTARGLLIEVTDDGRGPTGRREGGHGLVGMRERVAVYGGRLDTGPGADGGFRVAAQLPYDAEALP